MERHPPCEEPDQPARGGKTVKNDIKCHKSANSAKTPYFVGKQQASERAGMPATLDDAQKEPRLPVGKLTPLKIVARMSGFINPCCNERYETSVRTLSAHVTGQGGQKVASASFASFVKCLQTNSCAVEIAKNFRVSVRCPGNARSLSAGLSA
jgi:hypothetical protein